MVATVIFNEKNLVGEVDTAKDGGVIRFKNADNATVDAVDPLVIPTALREYSFEKVLRLKITGTGPDTSITDVEFYMDGSKGWEALVKLWGRNLAAFTTPAIPSESNDPPEIPVGGTPVAATDAFVWTAGSPLSLGAGPFSSTNTDFGDYVYLVMEVEIGATQGTLTNETLTFEYDEI